MLFFDQKHMPSGGREFVGQKGAGRAGTDNNRIVSESRHNVSPAMMAVRHSHGHPDFYQFGGGSGKMHRRAGSAVPIDRLSDLDSRGRMMVYEGQSNPGRRPTINPTQEAICEHALCAWL
jgi:hypothetical protein